MPITVIVRETVRETVRGTGAARRPGAESAASLTFDGPRIVIGRGGASDVRLPDPSVSLRHASIRATGTDYALVDEGSTNGTSVGGVKLAPQTPRLLKSGDLVRVGRVWLELSTDHRPPTPEPGLATRDLALAFVRRAMDADGSDTLTKVRVVEGADLGVELCLREDGRSYVVGRAESCDLPLADADVSREHVVVTKRGGQVLLRDLGALNGVHLGTTRLSPDRETVWRPHLVARIGNTVLSLEEPVSARLADLEAAEDEKLGDEEVAALSAREAAGDPPSEHLSGVPPSETAARAAAPVATVAEGLPARARPRRRSWTLTDVVVVVLATSVIGASLAGLVWVLR